MKLKKYIKEEKILKNGLRRRLKKISDIEKKEKETKIEETPLKENVVENAKLDETKITSTVSEKASTPSTQLPDQILMIDTSNLVHEEYQQTQEIKALCNEILKTIRDIISLNPIYRYFYHLKQKIIK